MGDTQTGTLGHCNGSRLGSRAHRVYPSNGHHLPGLVATARAKRINDAVWSPWHERNENTSKTKKWRSLVAKMEKNSKTNKTYPFTGLIIAEEENLSWRALLAVIKTYGNKEASAEAFEGLIGGGKPTYRGFKACYENKLSQHHLQQFYGTWARVHEKWAQKTAASNNGVSVPLKIVGAPAELPPAVLKVLECDGQLAFTGATRLLKEFVDPTMLGAAPGQHAPTFKWEAKDLVYVCEANFTKARVITLLQDAVNTHMAHAKVQILAQ